MAISTSTKNSILSEEALIGHELVNSQMRFFTCTVVFFTASPSLETDDPHTSLPPIQLISSQALDHFYNFFISLPAHDRSPMMEFSAELAQRVPALIDAWNGVRAESLEAQGTKAWTVLNQAVKSAPVILLDYIATERPARFAGKAVDSWSKAQRELFMAMATSVFPQLFTGVEKVGAISWLSSVRDFQSLSEEQQDAFLDSIGRRFEIDTTSDEWKKQKAVSRHISSAETISELPAGLFPFRNWAKLRDISLDKLIAYEQALQNRLFAALLLLRLPGFNFISDESRKIPGISEPSYIRERMDKATEEARDIVRMCELRREQQRVKEEQLTQRQLQAALLRAAQVEAIQRGELVEFHNDFQLTPLDSTSEKLLENFAKAAVKQNEQPNRAAFLEAVDAVRQLFLDYRGGAIDRRGDPEIKQLTDILLSPTSLTIAAHALGNDTTKHFTPYFVPNRTPIVQSAEDLGRLYTESAAAKKQLDAIINERSLAVVVAAVALPIDEIRSFISLMCSKGIKEDEKRAKHQDFASRIQTALVRHDDIRAVKSLRGEARGTPKSGNDKVTATMIPEWLTAKMAEYVNFTCFVDPSDGAVVIFLNPDADQRPEIYFEIPKAQLKSPEGFDSFFSRELDRAYKVKEYGDRLNELISLGLNVDIISGDNPKTRVWHADAQIHQEFSGDVRDIKKFGLIKAQFEEYLGLSEAVIEYATQAGFACRETSQSSETTMRFKDEGVISVPKFVTREQFDELTTRINLLITKHSVAEELQIRRETNRLREEERAKREVQPVDGERVLIVDANVLLMWSAPVPEREDVTFLEVLKAYARHTGSRIWIPARVLYEVLGDVCFLNSELHVERVSIRTYSRDVSKPISALIDGAAHVALLDSDGDSAPEVKYRAKRGSNSLVTIVYTPEDLEFLNKAREAGDSSREKQNFARSYLKRDLGDYAITNILNRFDIVGCEVSVVTADKRYAESDMPTVARNGELVNWKKPFSLLYSAMRLSADALANFPSANEAKTVIWSWQAARTEGRS